MNIIYTIRNKMVIKMVKLIDTSRGTLYAGSDCPIGYNENELKSSDELIKDLYFLYDNGVITMKELLYHAKICRYEYTEEKLIEWIKEELKFLGNAKMLLKTMVWESQFEINKLMLKYKIKNCKKYKDELEDNYKDLINYLEQRRNIKRKKLISLFNKYKIPTIYVDIILSELGFKYNNKLKEYKR